MVIKTYLVRTVPLMDLPNCRINGLGCQTQILRSHKYIKPHNAQIRSRDRCKKPHTRSTYHVILSRSDTTSVEVRTNLHKYFPLPTVSRRAYNTGPTYRERRRTEKPRRSMESGPSPGDKAGRHTHKLQTNPNLSKWMNTPAGYHKKRHENTELQVRQRHPNNFGKTRQSRTVTVPSVTSATVFLSWVLFTNS